MRTAESLQKTFLTFAELECKSSSELYYELAQKIALDADLLELCQAEKRGQPIPNLLFAAVHYLLLRGSDHPLKQFYPSVVAHPDQTGDAFAAFKEFCLSHQEEIEQLLQTKIVQTNEVRRCAYLYPVFSAVYKTQKPLALIEIGTSAGLQLFWDKYAYAYGDGNTYGNEKSSLLLTTAIKSEVRPPMPNEVPPVTDRFGLDLNTIDLHNEDEKQWLKALIWPEHQERLALFEQAATYVLEGSVHFKDGDGIAQLEPIANMIDKDSTICIFHTHVANQLPAEAKERLLNTIAAIGQTRDVFHIYNNMTDPYLHGDAIINGTERKQTLAVTEGHGKWVEWLTDKLF
ncbi:LOW QUALITY PROTEIN: hypothetical protein JCM19046_4399 [Bacillus sp. JCM 19046]|nr:LOW QUALITY PROTEIN: hypothetical protein JCM19045_4632 [Bacillus sp. JCM 19045]GAF19728.1 LOW QUALITY PROTEIN: hypothetical protein JCM19046_4399 [Bacillus sp. JCM 19046]